MLIPRTVVWSLVLAMLALCPRAHATPRALPFTYNTESLARGELELELYGDMTPLKATSTSDGAPVWYGASQFQTELEYGISDRLELGLYFVFAPSPGDAYTSTPRMPESTGMKQRLRYTLAVPGEWPLDVGLYGEVVENEREVELEAKLLLQRRLGKLRLAANLGAEYELYFASSQRDVVVDPTFGATYELSPSVHLGAEGWLRVEFPNSAPHPRPYALGPAVYAGPALLVNWGRVWWTTGLYGRVTETDHSLQPGEPFGPLWGRIVVGIEL